MEPLKPPPLRRGDLIALIAPASPIADPSRIERGARYLEGLGYRTIVGMNATKTYGYLAGTDAERVSDLHVMFGKKEVKAIMCIRGGYGTPRMLSILDYRLIARNPKIVLGYSDITALSLALWRRTGLVTFHGPMVGVDMADQMDQFTEELLWRTLTSTRKIGRIPLPDPAPSVLSPGRSVGRLFGGNLSLIISLLGTRFQPDFRGAVLFMEDIGEEPYRIDRMLAQLKNAAILSRVSAILTGQFTDCLPKDTTKPSLTVDQLFLQCAEAAGKPFLSNVPFGHDARKMTIPVGIKARVDAGTGTIEYLESAVR